MLRLAERAGLAESKRDVEGARAGMLEDVKLVEGAPQRLLAIEDRQLAGRAARVYRPQHSTGPALLYLHGGGWTVGSVRSHDRLCQRIAAVSGYTLVSFDYRLAPEHPFPAPLDDTLVAFEALVDEAPALGLDPQRLAIGGDSAGGNLAAAACIDLRDRGGPLPWLQVLIYPACDLRLLADSIDEFATGFVLTRQSMIWYRGHYTQDFEDPRASVLLAELHDLPPAIVHTAGFDPLRDEGEDYAARLTAAGVRTVHLDAADQIHGFANMDGLLPGARREVDRLALTLKAHARG